MAAPNINNVMRQLEGQIAGEIYSRNLHSSVWVDLPKQEAWPEGQGNVIQALTLNRSLPANTLSWSDIDASAGEAGGTCIPPVQRLNITNSVTEYNLQHTALESPDLCLHDLMNSYRAQEQLSHLMEVLSENTRQVWIDRHRSEYTRIAAHKLLATGTGFLEPVSGAFAAPTGTGATAPAKLKGLHLKQAYARSVRLGAGARGNYGTVNGRPSFLALLGMETSEQIATETDYRQDTRWSDRVPELLAPLGIERMFKGFWLADEVFPPRYNYTSGAWVEVKPYIWSGSGASAVLIENPAYETATYEDTVVYNSEVMRSVIMPPARNYGQASFDPQRYRGDWSWKNIVERTDNPDGNYGFFRGVFASGTKPVFPQYGIVIRHLRGTIDA